LFFHPFSVLTFFPPKLCLLFPARTFGWFSLTIDRHPLLYSQGRTRSPPRQSFIDVSLFSYPYPPVTTSLPRLIFLTTQALWPKLLDQISTISDLETAGHPLTLSVTSYPIFPTSRSPAKNLSTRIVDTLSGYPLPFGVFTCLSPVFSSSRSKISLLSSDRPYMAYVSRSPYS